MRHLAEVQRRRQLPTRAIQFIQRMVQEHIVMNALRSDQVIRVPSFVRWLLKMPVLRDVAPRVLGFGINCPRVEARAAGT
jgi:hypothetical protein